MIRKRIVAQESKRWSGAPARDPRRKVRCDGSDGDASGGEALFFREYYDRAMSIHGSVPAGRVAVILPTRRSNGTATFCGREFTSDHFAACLPRDPITICTPEAYRCINFSVCSRRLDQAFRHLHQRGLDELIPLTAVCTAPPGLVTRLYAAADASINESEFCGGCRMTDEAVLMALGAALTAGGPPVSARLAARNHWRCVRKVRDFVEAHLGEPLGIEMLCQTAGVSERTLTNAFREVLGVSPWQFIKARRLSAARQTLSAESGTNTSVKNVARNLGFTHLGYFARDYRSHFGEKPSHTLACGGSRGKGISHFA